MAPRLRSGFFFSGARAWLSLGGRTMDWISSELMTRLRSALDMQLRGTLKPPFWALTVFWVPNTASSLANAAFVQMQKRPRWPPGASCSRFSRSTCASSTPGMLRNAAWMPSSWSYTTRGPRRMVYRRFRILPLPVCSSLLALLLDTSGMAPTCLSSASAALVLARDWAASETTKGTSGTASILWPRAITRLGSAEAASALATA